MAIDPKKIEEWKAECAYTRDTDGVTWEHKARGPAVIAHEAVPALLAEREEVLALLREVEWSATIDQNAGGEHACPECFCGEPEGHAPDCRLAAFLGRGGA